MFASSNRPLAQKGGPEGNEHSRWRNYKPKKEQRKNEWYEDWKENQLLFYFDSTTCKSVVENHTIWSSFCLVDMAERAVIAALLKHNNLVEEAHLCAQMLTKTEPKQTRSLHHIWDRAYKVRVWIMEQFQKTRTGTPSERFFDLFSFLSYCSFSSCESLLYRQWNFCLTSFFELWTWLSFPVPLPRELFSSGVKLQWMWRRECSFYFSWILPPHNLIRFVKLHEVFPFPYSLHFLVEARQGTSFVFLLDRIFVFIKMTEMSFRSSPPSSPKSLKSARTLADVGITPPRALSSGDLKVVPATTSKTPLQEEKSTFVVSSSLSSSPNLPVKKTLPLESIFDCNHPLNRSRSKSGSSPHLSLTKIEEQNEEQSFHTTGSNSQFNLRSSSSLSLLTKKLSPDTPLTHPPKLKKMPRSKSECIIQVNLTKIQMKEEEVKKQRYQRIRHSFAMWKRIRAKLNANQDQDPNSPRQSVHFNFVLSNCSFDLSQQIIWQENKTLHEFNHRYLLLFCRLTNSIVMWYSCLHSKSRLVCLGPWNFRFSDFFCKIGHWKGW